MRASSRGTAKGRETEKKRREGEGNKEKEKKETVRSRKVRMGTNEETRR